MFMAFIVLRARNNNSGNVLKIPRNNVAAYLFGISGLLTTVFAMIMSIIPSPEITNVFLYELKVIGGFIMFVATGVIIYQLKPKK